MAMAVIFSQGSYSQFVVIPVQADTIDRQKRRWRKIPACAGMTPVFLIETNTSGELNSGAL